MTEEWEHTSLTFNHLNSNHSNIFTILDSNSFCFHHSTKSPLPKDHSWYKQNIVSNIYPVLSVLWETLEEHNSTKMTGTYIWKCWTQTHLLSYIRLKENITVQRCVEMTYESAEHGTDILPTMPHDKVSRVINLKRVKRNSSMRYVNTKKWTSIKTHKKD